MVTIDPIQRQPLHRSTCSGGDEPLANVCPVDTSKSIADEFSRPEANSNQGTIRRKVIREQVFGESAGEANSRAGLVTLQDIAAQLGVHRSTVALALRDNPRIGRELREKIKLVAAARGYRINPLVAALMKSRRLSNAVPYVTIAFVTNYSTRYGWRPQHHARPDFFPGASERAQHLGYKLEPFWLAEEGMTPERFRQILITRGITGMIIGRMPPGQNLLDLNLENFSAVALGMTLQSPRLHHVTENHFDTAWQIMEQCKKRGYRRVGFVFSEANDSPCVGDRWLGAYFLQQAKLAETDRVPLCPGMPTDKATFCKWFLREKPDALIVTHARPVLEWLNGIGFQVPRDLGLAELQDEPDFGTSGIYYNAAKIGAVAIDLLVGLMQRNETGIPREQHELLLSGEWREGKTLPYRAGLAEANILAKAESACVG